MKVESVVFTIDDVLYDTSQQLSASRMSAVKAMRSAGLPIDVETAYRKLEEIVKERGPDDTRHFDTLLERLGLKWNPEVIAAGVVAYRATSPIYLTPFPDTVGRGANYATALEGALKLKESCNVMAEGHAAREFLHGPMQLVDESTPVIAISTKSDYASLEPLSESFGRLGAPILRISEFGLPRSEESQLLVAEGLSELLSSLAL